MATRIIALDLGLTTGYAVLDMGNNLHGHGVFTEEDLDTGIVLLLSKYTPTYTVCERPVVFRGELGDKLQKVILTADRLLSPFGTNKWIGPDVWKPTPHGRAEVPKKITAHERDAIRMGLWFVSWLKRS